MRHESKLAIIAASLVLGGCLLAAGVPATAQASVPGPVTVTQSKRAVTAAHRATLRAQAREREARSVLYSTRLYSGRYTPAVGRWVFAARRAGWLWGQLDTLFGLMFRESRGDEHAKNPSSTASGGGQFLAFWWDGSDGSIRALFAKYHLPYPWNPFSMWQTLLHWRAVVTAQGWGAWAT